MNSQRIINWFCALGSIPFISFIVWSASVYIFSGKPLVNSFDRCGAALFIIGLLTMAGIFNNLLRDEAL